MGSGEGPGEKTGEIDKKLKIGRARRSQIGSNKLESVGLL